LKITPVNVNELVIVELLFDFVLNFCAPDEESNKIRWIPKIPLNFVPNTLDLGLPHGVEEYEYKIRWIPPVVDDHTARDSCEFIGHSPHSPAYQ
jgi:hypothetical protein